MKISLLNLLHKLLYAIFVILKKTVPFRSRRLQAAFVILKGTVPSRSWRLQAAFVILKGTVPFRSRRLQAAFVILEIGLYGTVPSLVCRSLGTEQFLSG